MLDSNIIAGFSVIIAMSILIVWFANKLVKHQ